MLLHHELIPLPEPVYRLAESEWKAFVEEFTDLLVEADPQIPHLPPKDVIHRIYRDVCREDFSERSAMSYSHVPGAFQQ